MRVCHAIAGLALGAACATGSAADVVTGWNGVLLDTIRAESLPPPRASRALAIVTTAVFDAANAADPRYAAYRPTAPVPGASATAAAAQAAHDTLALLFPAREADYAARLAADLATIPDGPARQAGIALGSAVARNAVDARATDGAAAAATAIFATGAESTGVVEPGRWRPTPPAFAAPLLPGWGAVTPFGIPATAAFLPPPPPATGSPEYVADVAAVQALGGVGSVLRTADQTEIARFWSDGVGTATPPGHWNDIAASVAEARGLGLLESARLFAMLNVALADAAIVAWDAKYRYDLWRPITAIRQAGEVPATAALQDETWTPLLATPPFPEYVSGHSTFSAAAAAVLASCFGTDDVSFTTTSDTLGPTVSRSFTSFSAAAAEAGVSRIYGGIHFPSGNTSGGAVGRAIGSSIADRLFAPVPEPGSLALATAAVMAILVRGLFQPRSLLAGASPPRRSIASPASVSAWSSWRGEAPGITTSCSPCRISRRRAARGGQTGRDVPRRRSERLACRVTEHRGVRPTGIPCLASTHRHRGQRRAGDLNSRSRTPMPDDPRYRHRHGPDAQTSEVEGRYFCDSCNQEVFVPIDVSAGLHQDFVEECPVCGSPMALRADIQQDGRARVDGQRE